jgi:uncharacterized low-complexity protein
MSDKKIVKPVAFAVGAALAGSFALASGAANADTGTSPFAMSTLHAGYMLGDGEGSCGGDKAKEGSCGGDKAKEGEGSCGEKKDGEGSCGEKKAEGKCGEGSCGEDT